MRTQLVTKKKKRKKQKAEPKIQGLRRGWEGKIEVVIN